MNFKCRAGVAYGRPMVVFLEGVVGLVWVLFLRAAGARKNVLFCAFLSLSGGSRYRFWTQLAEMRLYVHFGLPTDRLGRVLAMLDEARLSQRSAGGDFARKGVLTPVPPFESLFLWRLQVGFSGRRFCDGDIKNFDGA